LDVPCAFASPDGIGLEHSHVHCFSLDASLTAVSAPTALNMTRALALFDGGDALQPPLELLLL